MCGQAFMMGKLKIKGNIMLLQKLNSLWLDLQKAGKAPELPFLTDMMLKTVCELNSQLSDMLYRY